MDKIQFSRFINSFLKEKDYQLPHLWNDYNVTRFYLKGGGYEEVMIDNEKYIINIIKTKTDQEIEIQLLTLDKNDIQQCGLILLDSKNKIGYINDIHFYNTCIKGKINNGSLLMKSMIEICKKNNMKQIILYDKSTKLCLNKYKFQLKYLYTLLHGYPWYSKFNFTPLLDKDIKVFKHNYNIMKNLKIGDIKEILQKLNIYPIENYDNKYARHLFSKIVEKDCKLFYDIYEQLYKSIGLKLYSDKFTTSLEFQLEL